MKLGGFIIHGNNVDTLAAALSSLQQVCDDVVAIDTGSTDGSAAVVAAHGVRHASVEWAGFGAARRAAVEQLPDADYLLFLDSDEFLEPESIRQIVTWKRERERERNDGSLLRAEATGLVLRRADASLRLQE